MIFRHRKKSADYYKIVDAREIVGKKRHKQAKIRKRRNQKKIPTPKAEVGKIQTNNQVLIP